MEFENREIQISINIGELNIEEHVLESFKLSMGNY